MKTTKSKDSSKIQVRNRFDRVRRTVVEAIPPQGSLTQQQFKDECDMNRIVRNAMRGIAPRHLNPGVPHFDDFSEVPDLMTAYDLVAKAEEAFSSLPAALRAELGNDPARITELSDDQIHRYKLGKSSPERLDGNGGVNPSSSSPAFSSPGQGEMAGTEPATAPSGAAIPNKKGHPK